MTWQPEDTSSKYACKICVRNGKEHICRTADTIEKKKQLLPTMKWRDLKSMTSLCNKNGKNAPRIRPQGCTTQSKRTKTQNEWSSSVCLQRVDPVTAGHADHQRRIRSTDANPPDLTLYQKGGASVKQKTRVFSAGICVYVVGRLIALIDLPKNDLSKSNCQDGFFVYAGTRSSESFGLEKFKKKIGIRMHGETARNGIFWVLKKFISSFLKWGPRFN